jgi:hypothetical protein
MWRARQCKSQSVNIRAFDFIAEQSRPLWSSQVHVSMFDVFQRAGSRFKPRRQTNWRCPKRFLSTRLMFRPASELLHSLAFDGYADFAHSSVQHPISSWIAVTARAMALDETMRLFWMNHTNW